MYSVPGYHTALAEFSVSLKPHFKYQSAFVDPDHNFLELRFPASKIFHNFQCMHPPKT